MAAWVHMPREAGGRRKLAMILPLVIIGAALGFLDQETQPLLDRIFGSWSFGREAVVVMAAALAWFLITTVVLTRMARKRIAAWALPATDTMIEQDADGIAITQNGQTSRRRWETFGASQFGKGHVFLSASEDDVIIVPRRAFETDEEMAAFARFAEERIAETEYRASTS